MHLLSLSLSSFTVAAVSPGLIVIATLFTVIDELELPEMLFVLEEGVHLDLLSPHTPLLL